MLEWHSVSNELPKPYSEVLLFRYYDEYPVTAIYLPEETLLNGFTTPPRWCINQNNVCNKLVFDVPKPYFYWAYMNYPKGSQ